MKLSKSILLPLLGFATLGFFIGLSYTNGQLFIKELLISGFILMLLFIIKVGSKVKRTEEVNKLEPTVQKTRERVEAKAEAEAETVSLV